ncbi:hypothetical protein [Dyadobacter sp. NIV53]|uniref:hypothetical protein n=1 Tax=Dyadobacter sp. NIV53 TaxID=2861765 RepID=UPI001C88570A|nr:hypothetical protein [Dyadobacter sp. NIV53]
MKTNNPVIKYAKHLLIGLSVITISFIILYPQLFSCETIRFTGFRKLQENIFVSPDIQSAHFKQIKRVVQSAEMRIDSFYSGKNPNLILLSAVIPSSIKNIVTVPKEQVAAWEHPGEVLSLFSTYRIWT